MRIAAGVMEIVSGVISLIAFIALVIATAVTGSISQGWWGWWDYVPYTSGIDIATAVLIPITIVVGIVGVLSLVGGIFALQRKKWGLVLTGSILSLFPTFILGLLAIIFTRITKNEFE